MNESESFLTAEGAQRLRDELDELRGPKRRALAKRLRHAVQQGDLTENADYIMAKEEQAFLEGRILDLENLLRAATIVESPAQDGRIQVGNTVVVSAAGGEPEQFILVGAREADPKAGRISHESPFGKALMGRKAGELAIANTPGGDIQLRILEVR